MSAHSERTTKYWEPGLGPCVCEHCDKLPWSVSASISARFTRDHTTENRLAIEAYERAVLDETGATIKYPSSKPEQQIGATKGEK